MRTEVKTFLVTCDHCKHTELVNSKWSFCELPEGWGQAEIQDCGSTGYTKEEDICAECLKKLKRKKK